MLHVADAADAIVRALTTPGRAREAINISYGEPSDLVTVARVIAELGGTRSTVEASSEHPRMHLVAARAQKLLGWTPPSLRERLARLYEAYAA